MNTSKTKRMALIGASLLTAVLAGCSQYDADGAIVEVRGEHYELQHRFLDAYVLHKMDKADIDKLREKLDAVKDR
jgi:hypothetical protein